MNKADIYKYLDDHHIWHVVTEHGPVFTMEELTHVGLAYPEAEGKNLFIRDSGKKQYFLLTVKGDVPVDLKKFRANQGTRRLSFAFFKPVISAVAAPYSLAWEVGVWTS